MGNVEIGNKSQTKEADIYRLRRRFFKDQNPTTQSRFFARKQVCLFEKL